MVARPGDAAQEPCLARRDGVGAGAEQLAGLEVEEHQRGALDSDADLPPGEDLRSKHDVATQRDGPGPGHDAFDLDDGVGFEGGRQRRRTGWFGAPGDEVGQVAHRQPGADRLDAGSVDAQVDHVAVDPEPHDLIDPGRSQPELLPAQLHVP